MRYDKWLSGYPLGKFKELGYLPGIENPLVRNDLTKMLADLGPGAPEF